MGIAIDPVTNGLATGDLNRIFEYWESLRLQGGLPRYGDLDPGAIVKLLPKVNLVDVIWDGDRRRYRHRLVGTGVVEFFRVEPTGQWFDQIYTAEHLEQQLPAYERAACEGQPTINTVHVPLQTNILEKGPDLNYWRLILPLTRDGTRVDMLLLLFEPVSTDPSYPQRFPIYRHQQRVLDTPTVRAAFPGSSAPQDRPQL